jgi:glycosyltransferase involved in cell wall biosynthesis
VAVHIRGQLGAQHASMAQTLPKRLAAAGLSEHVDVHLAHLPEARLDHLLEQADIALLPCGEGSCSGESLALMRAQAWSVAAVAADVGCLREMLEPGREGLLYRCGHAEELAAQLEDLIENPERRKALAQALRERAVRERAAGRIAMQMEEIYQELLAARRQGRALRLPAGTRLSGGGSNEQ